ncbi:TolC family protein [Poseidonibacter lekithochrous]|uniref:TolC family protein n=1 Tax=Poseidonibacter lekithochrous TaxID=1904463 RepID=UPI0008FCDF2F|nr:TolC family protein [Poseidonibacter lekithochrous]QKJ22498.1 RND family efflux system, outer membrane channel protein, TolC family [Poseidonibacter lekithochrous]
MKNSILILCLALGLNAQSIKDNKLQEIEETKNKSTLESSLLKDSWINPINISADSTKSKSGNSKSTSNKIYLDINQDIFRSGGILYTIQKAKLQKDLAHQNYDLNLNSLNIDIYKLVLQLNKIDYQIEKQDYLIKNKSLEIDKKQAQYINGVISIEDLDSAIIEKNDLENQIEDLKTSKDDFEKQLKNLSTTSYKKILVNKIEVINLKSFLDNNKTLIIENLNSEISQKDLSITNTNYLPKVSLFSQIGYEDNNANDINDDYYNYGVRVSIPLDFNMNKNKQISKINYKLSKIKGNIKKDDEINKYEATLKSLKRIDNKIKNSQKSIKNYENIYKLTQGLYEGLLKTKQDLLTIENRLKSSKLDINILKIDKQISIYELHRNISIVMQ